MKYEIIEQELAHYNLLQKSYCPKQLDITGVQTDSRQVKPGDAFVCISGFEQDGHTYAHVAANAGAALIITEHWLQLDTPQVVVTNGRQAAALMARLLFKHPSADFFLIGVTGTNGKTTTSFVIYQLLRKLGVRAGLIGTLGAWIDDQFIPGERTTPDIIALNSMLADMAQAKLEAVVMEVSSHAIALDRVWGLDFNQALFLNLSRDHLDFHGDMLTYEQVKCGWLNTVLLNGGSAFVNSDDDAGKRFRDAHPEALDFGLDATNYKLQNLQTGIQGGSFTLSGFKTSLTTPLIGEFNIYNTAAALVSLHKAGFDAEKLAGVLPAVTGAPGRMQRVNNSNVFIDYAHTPDAVANVCKSAKAVTSGRLLCVIGAGGDRDTGKRPQMLSQAVRYCQTVIVTDDNPRSENPDNIIRQLLEGASPNDPIWVTRDRALAIKQVVSLANAYDTVLILGKGHEEYQEVNGVKHHFSDYQQALNALNTPLPALPEQSGKATLQLYLPVSSLLLEHLWQTQPLGRQQVFTHLSTDTRTIVPHSLFFAIIGDNFDGHAFIDTALQTAGCWAVAESPKPESVITISDTLIAWLSLAAHYKNLFATKRIALTGSYGKTTTKEFLAGILASQGVLKTYANENNLIGLPRTLFNLQPKHKWAVLELGTNQPGEIARLAAVAKPQTAIIISIAASHLEKLGDLNGVYQEKTALFHQPGVNQLYHPCMPEFAEFTDRAQSVGQHQICSRPYWVKQSGSRITLHLDGYDFELNTPVPFYALNAAFAAAVALDLGLSPAQVTTGLAKPLKTGNRMHLLTKGERTIIADCYNANPSSMQAAIEYCASLNPNHPHVYILGDMLELGPDALVYHTKIAKQVANLNPNLVFAVGQFAYCFATEHRFKDVDALLNSGKLALIPYNAVVLVKASHGVKLEKTIKEL